MDLTLVIVGVIVVAIIASIVSNKRKNSNKKPSGGSGDGIPRPPRDIPQDNKPPQAPKAPQPIDLSEIPELTDVVEEPASPKKPVEIIPDLKTMTKADLITLAESKGIDFKKSWTKAKIIEAFETQYNG